MLYFQALLLLFVAITTAVEIEPNSKSIEKKQEKRGINSLGYGYGSSGLGYGSSGLGYDNGAFGGYGGYGNGGYATPLSYNRVHYTSGGKKKRPRGLRQCFNDIWIR